jgi:hypothetical protein
MAMAAIEIEPGRRARVFQRSTLIRMRLADMLVLMVAQMLHVLLSLVPAISGHSRPAQLKRQQDKHEDSEVTAHRKSLAAAE